MAKKKLIKEIIPRVVHPIFKQHFAYSLTKSGVLYRTVLEESLTEFGIIPPQSGILLILASHGDYNQNILGQEMSIDKASMVKFIDGLEKLGYIKRTVDPNDRRAKMITLTAEGKRIQKRFLKIHQELEQEIFKGFTLKEQDTLRELMPRVLASILEFINR